MKYDLLFNDKELVKLLKEKSFIYMRVLLHHRKKYFFRSYRKYKFFFKFVIRRRLLYKTLFITLFGKMVALNIKKRIVYIRDKDNFLQDKYEFSGNKFLNIFLIYVKRYLFYLNNLIFNHGKFFSKNFRTRTIALKRKKLYYFIYRKKRFFFKTFLYKKRNLEYFNQFNVIKKMRLYKKHLKFLLYKKLKIKKKKQYLFVGKYNNKLLHMFPFSLMFVIRAKIKKLMLFLFKLWKNLYIFLVELGKTGFFFNFFKFYYFKLFISICNIYKQLFFFIKGKSYNFFFIKIMKN